MQMKRQTETEREREREKEKETRVGDKPRHKNIQQSRQKIIEPEIQTNFMLGYLIRKRNAW